MRGGAAEGRPLVPPLAPVLNDAVELAGFWREVGERLARNWALIYGIGVAVAVMGIASDLEYFPDERRPLALALRGSFVAYFALQLVLAQVARNWVARHYQALMTGTLLLIGVTCSLMGGLTQVADNWYFVALLEIEFAGATFFFLPRRVFWPVLLFNTVFYMAAQILMNDYGPVAQKELTNIGVTLTVVAIMAGLTNHQILGFSMQGYRQRRELAESEERIATILASITDAFFTLDHQWRFAYFNREAERLLGKMGRPKEFLLGRNVWEEFPNIAADSVMFREFHRAAQNRVPVRFEEYYPLMDAHLEITAYPSERGLSVYAHDISDRKRAEKALQQAKQSLEIRVTERTAQLRELTAHLETVVEEERTRISREIHDELGQIISVLRMELARLRKRLPGTDASVLLQLQTLEELANETVQSVRRIAAELRPPVLDDLGLGAAVEWFCNSLRGRSQLEVACEITPFDLEVDSERSTALFRILQEALTNVVRHAGAERVWVHLRRDGDVVSLTVRDDGRGFDPAQQPSGRRGLGLIGARERVVQFGGSFEVRGGPGAGTTIAVSLPLGYNQADDRRSHA